MTVFTQSGDGWVGQRLTRRNGVDRACGTDDAFGAALATSPYGQLVIGAPGQRLEGNDWAGGAHIFEGVSADGRWTQQPLVSFDQSGFARAAAEVDDAFGGSVAFADYNGDGLVDVAIGAQGEDIDRDIDTGQATVLFGARSGDGRMTFDGEAYQGITQSVGGIVGENEDGDLYGLVGPSAAPLRPPARVAWFSVPDGPDPAAPSPPTRLVAWDGVRSTIVGDITLDDHDVAVTALALDPAGRMFGFAFDPAMPSSTPIGIDPATGRAAAVGEPLVGRIEGAAFAPDGTLYVMDHTRREVRSYPDDVLAFAYPDALGRDPASGADIAFDNDGQCILTGSVAAGPAPDGMVEQGEIYRCDVEAGTVEPIGMPRSFGFLDADGLAATGALAFAYDEQTCALRLHALDGRADDEMAFVSLEADPPEIRQLDPIGLDRGWPAHADGAGYPSVANSPECAGRIELCSNGVDDTGDERADCLDWRCVHAPVCLGGR